jgi:Chaperone for flagella basal body P-ring formation
VQRQLPRQAALHGSGRAISRQDLADAIRAALRNNDLPGASNVRAQDLHFAAPAVVPADAQWEVRRIDFDAALGQARFVLASRTDPSVLPFWVTLPARGTNGRGFTAFASGVTTAGDLGAESAAVRPMAARLAGRGQVIVQPGKPVRLHVVSGTLQMFLEVFPLERGALHQTVRVKLPGSGRVLQGQVIAPGLLEAAF